MSISVQPFPLIRASSYLPKGRISRFACSLKDLSCREGFSTKQQGYHQVHMFCRGFSSKIVHCLKKWFGADNRNKHKTWELGKIQILFLFERI